MAIPADGFTQNPTDPALGVPRIGGGTYKTPLDYIPVGQGFFVVGSATGGNILFRNSQRRALSIGSQSIFFKAQKLRTFNQQDNFDDDDNNYQELDDIDQENIEKQQVPLMKLGLDYTNEQDLKLHHQIGISFNSFNSFAYEPGYDAQSINDSNTTMNWKFENDDKRYVIAGVQSISESLEIPLEIKVDDKNSSIYLTIDEWQNIDRDVYLLDKLTEETKLLNNERVELNLDPATYTDRFAIAFRSNQTLSVEEKELKKVLISTRDKEILINNTGDSIVQEVEVYNILGKQLKEWNNFEDPKNIILDASTLDANIYIVKATTDKGATTLKVIL